MELRDYLIRACKLGYRVISRKTFLAPECDCDRQSSNDKIYALLSTGNPCMISRFGTTEINCINNYLCIHRNRSYWKKCLDYVTDYTHTPWWNRDHFVTMSLWSGIFPIGEATAERFAEVYLQNIPSIDLLACHQYFEKFMPLRNDVQRIQLEMLYPFFVERPWTRWLKGKKVLIVHPFEATIRQQYGRRKQLFAAEDVLPEFELKTLRAVQTVAGNQSEFKDWFEALSYMEQQIDQIDFDIALIGCGAYGLPLAAHVKQMGKQAVHLGGGLQLLFGILGKRWVEQYQGYWDYRPGVKISLDYRPLFNENWIYPLPEDTPRGIEKVEDSCYWK